MNFLKLYTILTAIILLTTLFFGLRPKGFNLSNNVEWLKDRPGIRLDKYSIAYTKLGKELIEKINHVDGNSYSVTILFRPESLDPFPFGQLLHAMFQKLQVPLRRWNITLPKFVSYYQTVLCQMPHHGHISLEILIGPFG